MGIEKPNYSEWLTKPCWNEQEILYLAMGLDPAYCPVNTTGVLIVDLEDGAITPTAGDTPYLTEICSAASSSHGLELMQLLTRGISAGLLKPLVTGGNCYDPTIVLAYLRQKNFQLPRDLLVVHLDGENNVSPKKKPPIRSNPLGVEIEEAIRELGDDYTAHQVMHKLKSYAGKAGSCIQDTGSDFVIWRNKDNEIAKLNTSALRKRLGRKNGRR